MINFPVPNGLRHVMLLDGTGTAVSNLKDIPPTTWPIP